MRQHSLSSSEPYTNIIALVSEYGIKAKSVIAVVGDGQTLDGRQSQDERPAFIDPKNPRSQEDALLVLNGELDKIRATHGADVDQLLRALPGAPTPSSSAAPPAAQTAEYEAAARLLSQAPTKITEQQQQEHVRLGEYLLQALLRFDSINIDGEWTDARARRKLAVKEVQGLLDRLDAGWKRAKAIESS